ncbi:MAG: sigma factor-like helix-turn-helix DNA-binding protein [Actinomycetota bacterium]|nr:sigma factor-like helix-turn-helix DNA-binding protein [Actinomycetota bacterium]
MGLVRGVVAPWGTPPTPLLPAAVRDQLAGLDVPAALRDEIDVATADGLDADAWGQRIHALDRGLLDELAQLIEANIERVDVGVPLLPKPGGRPLTLSALPISARARRAASRLELGDASKRRSATIADVLDQPYIGVKTMLELACVLEATVASDHEADGSHSAGLLRQDAADPEQWLVYLRELGAWAHGERGLSTLGQVFEIPVGEWPEEVAAYWRGVTMWPLAELAGNRVMRYSAAHFLADLTTNLDARSLDILRRRVLARVEPETLESLGERHDVGKEEVRRLEQEAIDALASRVADAAGGAARRRAAALGRSLGSAAPADDGDTRTAFGDATDDLDEPDLGLDLLLWMAGPYGEVDGWLVRDGYDRATTVAALRAATDDRGHLGWPKVYEVLTAQQIAPQFQDRWLRRLEGFSVVEDGLLDFTGSDLDKVERLIRYHDRPCSADELAAAVDGIDDVAALRAQLVEDERFWLVNRSGEFVLAGEPGYDEYSGVANALIEEIERRGGSAPADELVQALVERYDAEEVSVREYLDTLQFVRTADGEVRVRQPGDPFELDEDPVHAGRCYVVGDEVVLRVPVDRDTMSGHSRPIPEAVAVRLNCRPGGKVTFSSPTSTIGVSWLLTSTTGPVISSVRAEANGLGLGLGDWLVLRFTDGSVRGEGVRRAQLHAGSSRRTVAALAGLPPELTDDEASLRRALALATGMVVDGPIELDALADHLAARDEDDLVELLRGERR